MPKTPEMTEFIDRLTNAAFGHRRSSSISGKTCVICGKEVSQFRDKLSEKEYAISGFCQQCQDKTFGV